MYLNNFGFKRYPFHVTPDPEFIFLTACHEEALNRLRFGLDANSGFIVLTGEVGSGKTTILRRFINELKCQFALVFNPQDDFIKLLRQILDELEIRYEKDEDGPALIERLNERALSLHGRGEQLVIVIDEAQNLSLEVLESIRLLTNLETDKAKLLDIILAGQPELSGKLDSVRLIQLKQRIGMRYHLLPLSQEEMGPYIRHRLNIAGGNPDSIVFTPGALKKIFFYSGGVPRLV
ncbi:MAG: AAA family ATPase, partial [Candidatus Wallbacteria bacterium]|nr:AAA family ATPase [Candidatus Wallbacteria bacterium]